MTNDMPTLLGGFADVDRVQTNPRTPRRTEMPIGDFHATRDGLTALCGETIRSKTQPWGQRPMMRRRCLNCVAEGAPSDGELQEAEAALRDRGLS